ncbi:hypothetical protein PM082_000592 [Marasmius tenuissimus]|nr:hypothetical protein PM082_000592 [Marasmius tenuissimus]
MATQGSGGPDTTANRMVVDGAQNQEDPQTNPDAIRPQEMKAIIDAMKDGVNLFSQQMFGESRNEDAQIAVAGPMLYLMSKIMGVSLDPDVGASTQTRSTPDRKPRDPVANQESKIMRAWMKDNWEARLYPTPTEVAVRKQERDLWRDQRHHLYVEPFEQFWLESDTDRRAIVFSGATGAAEKAWNRAMAAYIVKHHLIVLMNAATQHQRVRDWDTDLEWNKDMIGRVTKHVDYVYAERRKDIQRKQVEKLKQKYAEGRVREYERRVQVARRYGWSKVESGLRKLGHDGMSSDEEEDPRAIPRREDIRAIHHHPWRSREATAMIRRMSVAVEEAQAAKGRRGNVRNVRKITAKTVDPSSSRRLHQPVPDLLPRNFYNWEIVGNRDFHRNMNVEGGANAARMLRPTEDTDELLLENFTA